MALVYLEMAAILGKALLGAGRDPRTFSMTGIFRIGRELRGSEKRGRGRQASALGALRSFACQRFDTGETVRLAGYGTWLE
jgi:hypothetical protein